MKINSLFEAPPEVSFQQAKPPANASAAYQATNQKIGQQLTAIQQLVADHNQRASKEQTNWGYHGDIEHVSALLDDVLEFLQTQ